MTIHTKYIPDPRVKTREEHIKDLEKIIKIQEDIIKTNNKTNRREIKTFEGLLERNYFSYTRVVQGALDWKLKAEQLYERLAAEINNKSKKGKNKNVEKKKKTKRGVKRK